VSPTRLPEALAGMRALGIVGLNVTVPHKEAVADLVDELGETAKALGAVNTVWNKEGTLYGYNTDGEGFLRSLRHAEESLVGKRVTLIGAGGAARAVALVAAREQAAGLSIVNRTLEKAQDLADLVNRQSSMKVGAVALSSKQAEGTVRDAEIVVDSTPCGMHPHSDDSPVVPADWLGPGQLVCDLVYTPRETCLLRAAAARGARTLDGTGMLVHQGAIALERWTGRPAPAATMQRALLAALQARERASGE